MFSSAIELDYIPGLPKGQPRQDPSCPGNDGPHLSKSDSRSSSGKPILAVRTTQPYLSEDISTRSLKAQCQQGAPPPECPVPLLLSHKTSSIGNRPTTLVHKSTYVQTGPPHWCTKPLTSKQAHHTGAQNLLCPNRPTARVHKTSFVQIGPPQWCTKPLMSRQAHHTGARILFCPKSCTYCCLYLNTTTYK
jgi:hypothetical protein